MPARTEEAKNRRQGWAVPTAEVEAVQWAELGGRGRSPMLTPQPRCSVTGWPG